MFRVYEGQSVTRIDLTGNKITKEYIIRRELKLTVGQPFRLATLQGDITRLENLAIFSSILVIPTQETEGVALEFNFREMPWILPSLSVGYTEQDGWSVGPAVAALNLLGRNIYLSANARFGGSTSYRLYFNYPWITWKHLSTEMTASHIIRNDKVLEFGETSDEITPWVGMYLGRHGRLRCGFSYFKMHSDTEGITLSSDNTDNLYRLGVSLAWDTRDSWRNPREGWHNEWVGMRTGGWLGGDGDSWLGVYDLRRFQPLMPAQTLVLGGLVSMQSGEVGRELPSYLQYFLGGSSSVRGYKTEELGKELFGKNQLIGTVEYHLLVQDLKEYRLLGLAFSLGLKLVAFTDVGLAWSRSEDFNWSRTAIGYGIGAHLLVPGVEVVRLDLGMSRRGDIVIHLAARPKLEAQRYRLR